MHSVTNTYRKNDSILNQPDQAASSPTCRGMESLTGSSTDISFPARPRSPEISLDVKNDAVLE